MQIKILCNNSIGLDWTNQFSQNCEQNGTCEWKHNQLLLYRLLIAHTHLLSVAHKHTKDWTLCNCGVWKDKLWNRKFLSTQTIASATVCTVLYVCVATYTHVVYEVLKGTTEEGGMYDNDIYVCTYKCSNYSVGDGGL